MKQILASTLWEQNRLVVTLALTFGIAAVAGVIYVLFTQWQRLAVFLSSGKAVWVIKFYRLALGAAAILVFALSLFPRSSSGMGGVLYFFLWPLIVGQFAVPFLHWQQLAQRKPPIAVLLAIVVGFFAFCIDRMLLQLAGYVT